MPWAGNIAKTMTSKRETVHCYPRNVDRCCTWSERAIEGGLMLSQEPHRVFQNLLLFLSSDYLHHSFAIIYNKSLNDWSLGEQWILFSSNLNVSLDFVSGNIEILGKQNSLFPSGPMIECLLFNSATITWVDYEVSSKVTWHIFPSENQSERKMKELVSWLMFSRG